MRERNQSRSLKAGRQPLGFHRQFSILMLKLAQKSGLFSGQHSLIYLYTDSSSLSLVIDEDKSLKLEVGIDSNHSSSFSSFGSEKWSITYKKGVVEFFRNNSGHEQTIEHPDFNKTMKRILRICAGWYSLIGD